MFIKGHTYHLVSSFLCCYFLLLSPASLAAKPSIDDLQSVVIYKVIQLTRWPNEDKLANFNIGVYGGSSSYIHNLNRNYKKRQIRDKKLSTSSISNYKKVSNISVLIIKGNKNNELEKIAKHFKQQKVLIISEYSDDKKHLMVNLLRAQKGGIDFEINRSNILLEGLKISKDIVMAGGSELDVAQIYDEAVTDLSKTKQVLSNREFELKQQSKLMARQSKQLKIQDKKIARQTESIKQQQSKMTKQSQQIKLKNEALKEKTLKLNQLESDLLTQIKIIDEGSIMLNKIENKLKDSTQSLKSQESKNLTLAEKIKANISILERQKISLTLKDAELKGKDKKLSLADKTLSQQETTIRTQQQFLLVFIIIALLFSALIIALYRIYIAKKKSSALLENKNKELQSTMNELHLTQEQLIESEKMASLGGMVAGIAHEVNTPAGIVLTADSSLQDKTIEIKEKLDTGALTQSMLANYIDYAIESTTLSIQNINRVAALIQNFKQVAVDQGSNEIREFNLADYLDEFIKSLAPTLFNLKHQIKVQCPPDIIMTSYPGVLANILHILISNSLAHGFDNISKGTISLVFKQLNNNLVFCYEDNGNGANKEIIDSIFEPFFTTKRGSGGSGLGTHILYNMVTQLLKGTIKCSPAADQGLRFDIEFSLSLDHLSSID